MYHPNELIQDIQARLDRLVLDYRTLLEKNKKLETENKSLAHSLEEALKQQETLTKRLDTIRQETLRDTKGLDHWKTETRKEIRGMMKEVEKCIPQVESLLEKK
jgi:cell division septum initiation protein DivIVA